MLNIIRHFKVDTTLEEKGTGFFQVVFLGLNISKSLSQFASENWEGRIHPIHFDKLEKSLVDPGTNLSWVETGRVAILVWLANNAPGLDSSMTFAGKTGLQVYQSVVKSLSKKK